MSVSAHLSADVRDQNLRRLPPLLRGMDGFFLRPPTSRGCSASGRCGGGCRRTPRRQLQHEGRVLLRQRRRAVLRRRRPLLKDAQRLGVVALQSLSLRLDCRVHCGGKLHLGVQRAPNEGLLQRGVAGGTGAPPLTVRLRGFGGRNSVSALNCYLLEWSASQGE